MSEGKTEWAGTLDHSETDENANGLTCNGSEHRTSNGEHLRNTGKEIAGGDNNEHDTKNSEDDVKVDEVNRNDVLPKSSKQNLDVAISEMTNKKPSAVSCDLESVRPTTAGPKTVRAWLKDPHLYKVILLSSLN